ncbi:hypothetical protein J3A84_04795 [Proteiniclasticum sp. SCR006]|uniref:Uncharacterized protein n=1 Tax=Proteiniclasticum aestuarii TaxID=2817862 RepID=A0A939KIP5_9CLOT|nr:hypothetical protein [Proteiniclasticum aestuarii]MBO1264358.1 hypothetical protein [Proteiniclasticum aestuarii]
MTRQELEQYPSLLKEIEYLKSKARQVENDHKAFMAADTVYGSTENNPQNRTITIHGIDWIAYDRKVNKYIKKLREAVDKASTLQLEIEEFIRLIPDSCTRTIFRMRYLDNKQFHQIAMELKLGGESTPRMRHNRYLDNYFLMCD